MSPGFFFLALNLNLALTLNPLVPEQLLKKKA